VPPSASVEDGAPVSAMRGVPGIAGDETIARSGNLGAAHIQNKRLLVA
jgi:hypothetical protein